MNIDETGLKDNTGDAIEGEYLGKELINEDPVQVAAELMQGVTRYMVENPKKTAVIVMATAAAAVTVAVAAAATTATLIGINSLRKHWSKSSRVGQV